ncbi:MAG: MotA/TolQ/ExbB proton channel family protein [Elusimicrobia bacterium]|nr:MotA/TolQ/ExbB proton channel family protein [Candidatus Liberimonas magnetica]
MITVDFFEVLRTSFTMIILLFCSIIALSFALERWWYFRKIRIDVDNFTTILYKYIQEKNFKQALDLCKPSNSPLARLMEVAILNSQKQKPQVVELMDATRLDKRVEMERFLIVLGTMGTVCPFIGLFGTVIGIIRAFHDLAMSGTGGPAIVAAGISEALVATAAGLAIAIPAVILYNYFMRKAKVISSQLESNQMRVLVHLGFN